MFLFKFNPLELIINQSVDIFWGRTLYMSSEKRMRITHGGNLACHSFPQQICIGCLSIQGNAGIASTYQPDYLGTDLKNIWGAH